MKTLPDDETLDALYKIITSENSLSAHISNAAQPNMANPHDSESMLEFYAENQDMLIGSTIRAARRFMKK